MRSKSENSDENPSGDSSESEVIDSESDKDPDKPLSEVKENSGSNVSFEHLSKYSKRESHIEMSRINKEIKINDL